jgi:hypothetical protein
MITAGQAQTAAEPRRAGVEDPPSWSDDMDTAPHRRTVLLSRAASRVNASGCLWSVDSRGC